MTAAPATPANYEAIAGVYVLQGALGQGCFATVYSAVHVESGVPVAVKIIDKRRCTNLDLIRNEISALRLASRSPFVVDVYEVTEDADHVYIVMEHCTGGNLHDYLVAHGSISEEQARLWFTQLVCAVEHCHKVGVLNGDIKNANVLIDSLGNAKLSDFGLATLVDNAYTTRIARATGSAVFAAPEVYMAHKGIPYIGASAEVWALGGVLHSMLTATLPYRIETYQQNWMTYRPPQKRSEDCQELLNSIFQFVPNKRPSTRQMLTHPWMLAPLSPAFVPSTLAQHQALCFFHNHEHFGADNSSSARSSGTVTPVSEPETPDTGMGGTDPYYRYPPMQQHHHQQPQHGEYYYNTAAPTQQHVHHHAQGSECDACHPHRHRLERIESVTVVPQLSAASSPQMGSGVATQPYHGHSRMLPWERMLQFHSDVDHEISAKTSPIVDIMDSCMKRPQQDIDAVHVLHRERQSFDTGVDAYTTFLILAAAARRVLLETEAQAMQTKAKEFGAYDARRSSQQLYDGLAVPRPCLCCMDAAAKDSTYAHLYRNSISSASAATLPHYDLHHHHQHQAVVFDRDGMADDHMHTQHHAIAANTKAERRHSGMSSHSSSYGSGASAAKRRPRAPTCGSQDGNASMHNHASSASRVGSGMFLAEAA